MTIKFAYNIAVVLFLSLAPCAAAQPDPQGDPAATSSDQHDPTTNVDCAEHPTDPRCAVVSQEHTRIYNDDGAAHTQGDRDPRPMNVDCADDPQDPRCLAHTQPQDQNDGPNP